jgi:hypothetical protein
MGNEMGASKASASSADKDASKLVAKLSLARGTASGYEAVVDAGAVLAMGGAVEEALECLRRVWACPESVHRLLVQGADAKANSFATWMYKKLGAWADPSGTARALSLSERELVAEVRGEEARLRHNLEGYLACPGDWETGRTDATKKAFALLRSLSDARAEGHLDAALAAGRELIALEASHHHYQLQRKQIVADVAFAAGEREEAYAVVKTAAHGARRVYDILRDELEVLLFFEWSGRALAQGQLGLPTLDPSLAKALVAAVREFFVRVGEPPARTVAWRPLLGKLAGAKALRKGATPAEVARLEERLGVKLPPSYAAFLSASNGLKRSKKSLALHAAADVAWFRDANPEWIEAYLGQGATIPYLADTLRIAAPEDGEVYLLNPKVKTKAGEWEAWHFADSMPGETRYGSFHELVENLLEST